MKFAKIVCGALQVPLEESEPEEREGKVVIAAYKVNKSKTKIVKSWLYEDIDVNIIEVNIPLS